MSTPIETAADEIAAASYGQELPESPLHFAEAALASLAQHRDDIARAAFLARQPEGRKALAEKVWQRAEDGEMDWDVRNDLLRDIDAVLAYLTQGAA